MLLSVIVPVFNMEKFLPRCLDSLLRQGMDVGEDDSAPDFEIVCVMTVLLTVHPLYWLIMQSVILVFSE